MRFGLLVDDLDPAEPLADLVRRARAAEDSGFDLVWLREARGVPAPQIAAAALAPHLATMHVGVDVVAGVNPVYLAEEAAVVDLCLGGRSVFAVRSDDAGLLAETVDVVLDGTAPRPFRHQGERWQIPANLPTNEVNRENRVRVTPASAQLELPVWVCGPHAAAIARERCLSFLGDAATGTAELAAEWAATEAHLGRATSRLRRPAIRTVDAEPDGSLDADAMVEALRADYRAWGLDVVLVDLPAGLDPAARERALDRLATRVLPRVQLDRLPPGLEDYWQQRQEAAP